MTDNVNHPFTIRAIDLASDDDMRMLNALEEACDRELFGGVQPMTVNERRAALEPSSFADKHRWVAEVRDPEGRPALAGIAMVSMPTQEHLDTATVGLGVHPDWRGQGIGTALAARVQECLTENRRTKVTVYGPVPSGADPHDASLPWNKFARRLGVSARNTATMKTLALPVPPTLLDELAASVPEAGYRLETWINDVPEEHLAEFGVVLRQLELDEPIGGAEKHVQEMPVERVREILQRGRDMGFTSIHTVAFAPDGTMAAQSEIAFKTTPGTTMGYQENTLVMPAHRGHRLGTLVKVANHRRLAEMAPHLRVLVTGNSDVNVHMNAINEKLGYRPAFTEVMYQS